MGQYDNTCSRENQIKSILSFLLLSPFLALSSTRHIIAEISAKGAISFIGWVSDPDSVIGFRVDDRDLMGHGFYRTGPHSLHSTRIR